LKGMLYCAGYNLEDVKDAFEKRLDMEPKTKENRYKRKVSSPIDYPWMNATGANLLTLSAEATRGVHGSFRDADN
jgi:hypothetical protein